MPQTLKQNEMYRNIKELYSVDQFRVALHRMPIPFEVLDFQECSSTFNKNQLILHDLFFCQGIKL